MSQIIIEDAGWKAIMADPQLIRARSKLSFHEIRLIVKHARTPDAQPSSTMLDILADLECALVLTSEHDPHASVSSFVASSTQFKRLADFLHERQHDAQPSSTEEVERVDGFAITMFRAFLVGVECNKGVRGWSRESSDLAEKAFVEALNDYAAAIAAMVTKP
jgi:hypothetical protein